MEFANQVWDEINLPNLEQNILPTRFRANLILEKANAILSEVLEFARYK